jgi:hypothetical protein
MFGQSALLWRNRHGCPGRRQFARYLAQLPEPRSRRGRRFPLAALLAANCAAIAQWARTSRPNFSTPSASYRRPPTDGAAFRYLFTLLDWRLPQSRLTQTRC